MGTPLKTYMTLDEVAEYLGVSRILVQRMIHRDELKAVKIGSGGRTSPYRVHREWVDQWADKNSNDPRTGR